MKPILINEITALCERNNVKVVSLSWDPDKCEWQVILVDIEESEAKDLSGNG